MSMSTGSRPRWKWAICSIIYDPSGADNPVGQQRVAAAGANPWPAAALSATRATWACSALAGIRPTLPRQAAAPDDALPRPAGHLSAGTVPATARSATRDPGSVSGLRDRRPLQLGRGWTELDKIADAANSGRPGRPGLNSGSGHIAAQAPADRERNAIETHVQDLHPRHSPRSEARRRATAHGLRSRVRRFESCWGRS